LAASVFKGISMRTRLVISFIALLLAHPVFAAGAPEQLKGKSIVVSWTETRQQRDETDGGGWGDFHMVNGAHKLTIYVSTAGRMFSRQTNSTSLGSGSIQEVAGQPHASQTPMFSGQSMTVVGTSTNKGGARRTVIDFDTSFSSCSAKVASAFESGKTSISRSPITHRLVDIKSVTTNGASCSIRSGNDFGGPA
jgi:hypothetical protein